MALAHLSTLADTVPVDGVTMTAPRMRPRLSFWTPIVIKRWQARLGSQALTDRELPGAPYLPVQPSPAESSLVAPTSVAISEGGLVALATPTQHTSPDYPSVPAQDTPKGLPAIPTKALPSASPTSTDPSPISSPTCTAEAFTTITINTGSGGLDRKLSVCSTSSSRYAGIPSSASQRPERPGGSRANGCHRSPVLAHLEDADAKTAGRAPAPPRARLQCVSPAHDATVSGRQALYQVRRPAWVAPLP